MCVLWHNFTVCVYCEAGQADVDSSLRTIEQSGTLEATETLIEIGKQTYKVRHSSNVLFSAEHHVLTQS